MDSTTFTEAFIHFSAIARNKGLQVGIDENIQSIQAALFGLWPEEPAFKYALRSIFCHSPQEVAILDELYDQFWKMRTSSLKSKMRFSKNTNAVRKSAQTLVMMGKGNNQEDQTLDAKQTTGSNYRETLMRTDFGKVADIDQAELEELAMQLFRQMTMRLKRKFKSGRKGRIHYAKTIRRSLQYGGDPIQLALRKEQQQKYRLVILLDVSGSMDKYSFYLLRFLLALKEQFSAIHAFVFSTQLVNITDHLHAKNLERSLSELSRHARCWSGGTRIGDCLQAFVENYGKLCLNGRSLTLVLSDGLDTGDPSILSNALKQIKRRTKKLIWLNPLKGMNDYQPIQKGMASALPELDVFQSAHNIQSLLALENILLHA